MTAAPFVGWQRQDNGPSVQGALEEAIFKLSGERVTVTGAGRTDAGVHALGQVAHFDLVKEFAADKIRDALNHFVRPAPIAVLEAAHRRRPISTRGSRRRRGTISIASSAAARRRRWSAAMSGMSCAISTPRRCITRRRRWSAQHDFTTFRAAECQAKSPVKTLDRLDVARARR